MKELERSYYELENSRNKYKIELSKEGERREKERQDTRAKTREDF